MSVQNFQSIISAQTVGTEDIDKVAQSMDRLSASIDGANTKSTALAGHPGFSSFGSNVKAGIEDPFNAASTAAEGLLKSLGPIGTGVAAGVGIFTAAAAAAYEAAKSLGEYGTSIENVAIRTGLSAQQVGQFSFAARVAGQDVSGFESSMRVLSRGLEDNSEQGQKARKALSELGVSAYDSTGKVRPMADIFLQLSEGLSAIDDPAKRTALGVEALGRGFVEMEPALLRLTEGMTRAKELGFGLSNSEIERMASYNSKIKEISTSWDELLLRLKEPVAAQVVVSLRALTGDTGDIGTDFTAALRKQIPSISAAEAQRRLDLAGNAGFLSGSRYQEMSGLIDKHDLPMFPSSLHVDMAGYSGRLGRIQSALAPDGAQRESTEARQQLQQMQQELQRLKELGAPISEQASKADEVLKQKQKVAGIEAEIKATQKLNEERQHLAELDTRSMEDWIKSPKPYTWSLGGGGAPISEYVTGPLAEAYRKRGALQVAEQAELSKAQNPEQQWRVITDFALQLGAATNEIAALVQKLSLAQVSVFADVPSIDTGKTYEEWAKRQKQQGGDFFADNPGLFSGGVTAPAGWVSPSLALRNARDTEQRGLGLYGVSAQLSGTSQTTAIEGEAALRKRYAEDVYAAMMRNAELEESEEDKKTARANALAELDQKIWDAETQRQESLLQLALQEKEGFQSFATGAFSAILQGAQSRGGAGAAFEKWGTGQLTGLADKIVSNLAGEAWGGVSKTIPNLSNIPVIGSLFKGTVFGGIASPQKISTDLNTTALTTLTAAVDANTASRAVAGGAGPGGDFGIPAGGYSSMWGGSSTQAGAPNDTSGLGFVGWTGSSPANGSGAAPSDIVTPSDGPLPTINWGTSSPLTKEGDDSSGSQFKLGNGIGIGMALAAGGVGIYSGIKAGGPQGDLEAVGSGVGMLGAVATQLSSLSSTLSTTLGPIGMALGVGLGVASMFLGNPKQNRQNQETENAVAARYTAPTPQNYTVDRYGTSSDMTMYGGFQPVTNNITLQVQALDSQSINDHAADILDAMSTGLEGNMSPRAATSLRNVVAPN